MASIKNIFEDPQGPELKTTAGGARADAPNTRIARQVEENASLEHRAAEQAASVAKTKGRRLTGEMPTSVDKLRNVPGEIVKDPLEKAVEEGKRDVAEFQAAGAEKLGQVKEMAAKATSSAQEHITPATKRTKEVQARSEPSGGIMPPLQGAAETLVGTTTSTLASTKAAATNAMGATTSTVRGISGTAGTQGAQLKDLPASSTGIPAPATIAPLGSAGKKLDTLYPKERSKDVAQNESSRNTSN